jgi:hypothetical protein
MSGEAKRRMDVGGRRSASPIILRYAVPDSAYPQHLFRPGHGLDGVLGVTVGANLWSWSWSWSWSCPGSVDSLALRIASCLGAQRQGCAFVV